MLVELLADAATDPAEAQRSGDAATTTPTASRTATRCSTCSSGSPPPGRDVARVRRGALAAAAAAVLDLVSPMAHPDEVHLTVGVVRYLNRLRPAVQGRRRRRSSPSASGRGRRCACSSTRRTASGCLRDGDTPMIMVGPGTGIAPFRAFLQERQALRRQRARTGCSSATSAATTTSSTATSWSVPARRRADAARHRVLPRPGGEGLRPAPHARSTPRIWEWLEEGAHFYVCGDAQRMASDVDEALKQIVAEQGVRSKQSQAYLAALARAGRYQRDVY